MKDEGRNRLIFVVKCILSNQSFQNFLTQVLHHYAKEVQSAELSRYNKNKHEKGKKRKEKLCLSFVGTFLF